MTQNFAILAAFLLAVLCVAEPSVSAESKHSSEDQQANSQIESLEVQIQADLARGDFQSGVMHITERAMLTNRRKISSFEIMRIEQLKWDEEGTREGNSLKLQIGIALAQENVKRAVSETERGMALNALGNSQVTLGERGSEPQILQAALATYQEALLHRHREQDPSGWAGTQDNIANVYSILAKRAGDVELMKKSAQIYRSVLQARSLERNPIDWARTQNNLGVTLKNIGQQNEDPVALREAVSAFRSALTVRKRHSSPKDWATTQTNLGNSLRLLGVMLHEANDIEESIISFRNALVVRTREIMPYDWAATQTNLGNAFYSLGVEKNDVGHLKEALATYNLVFEVVKVGQSPFLWAQLKVNVGTVEIALFRRLNKNDILMSALSHFEEAKKVFTSIGALDQVKAIDQSIRNAKLLLPPN